MEGNRIPKRVLYMNLGTTGLRGRPRNRWQDEVREDRRIVGGEGWQGRVHYREEWKKLLRMARNCHILHMPMEWLKYELNKRQWISMLEEIISVTVSQCPDWYLNIVCYFVFKVRLNMFWCGNVRSVLPTCLNVMALNSGNFMKN